MKPWNGKEFTNFFSNTINIIFTIKKSNISFHFFKMSENIMLSIFFLPKKSHSYIQKCPKSKYNNAFKVFFHQKKRFLVTSKLLLSLENGHSSPSKSETCAPGYVFLAKASWL